MIAPGERASPTLEEPVPPADALPASREQAAGAPTGQQLLAEFVRYGRQRPFEEITRRYAGMVFNTCFRVTKDKHDAEDATQAVFLTLAVQAKRGTDIKALGPWLQQVAKRLALDVRRGKKRRRTREERHHDEQERRRTGLDAEATPSADLDELKAILHEELQKLPAKYRLPLVLHYFGGMTREEMAAELNTKPSTLGVRIFRGREMLAGRLNGRGVHLPAGAMAVAIGYLVKRTVTDAMVATTGHAAAAIAGGADYATVGHLMAAHTGSTQAATAALRAVAIARRASHVLVIGKVRVTVAVALMAGTSLGAGVRAFALLPPITVHDVQQMISAGVTRLVRPLVAPDVPRMLSQVPPPTPAAHPAAAAAAAPAAAAVVLPPVVPPAAVATAASPAAPPVGTAPPAAATPPAPTTPGPILIPASRPEPVAVAAATPPKPANAGGGSEAGGGGGADARRVAADPTAVRATPMPILAAAGGGGGGPAGGGAAAQAPVALSAQDLYVPAGPAVGSYAAASNLMWAVPASQVQVVQVPAVGGSVTQSDGVVRGYGKIDRPGTLTVSGKVVADGDGHDRTLDLTSFSAVRVAPVAAPPGASAATGWYASDHGRLTLPLATAGGTTTTAAAAAATAATVVGPVVAAPAAGGTPVTVVQPTVGPTSTAMTAGAGTSLGVVGAAPQQPVVLTWGGTPSLAGGTLAAVNSVQLTLPADAATVPTALSLLATDRSDAPVPPSVDGATIGLWQVGAAGTTLSAADILVRYDDHLVDALGGDESAVRLWTLGGTGDLWQPVDPSSLVVDVVDHVVAGDGTDVDYFAVTVPPAAGVDAATITAHPQANVVGGGGGGGGGGTVVPEPTAVSLASAAAVALLGRRRRRNPRPV